MVLWVCDDVCGKKSCRRSKGETWWRNEKMKEAISRNKDAHWVMCRNSTEANKRRYEGVKNRPRKAVSKAIRDKAEEALTGLEIV